MNVGIIDYGLCNMFSIFSAVESLGHKSYFIKNSQDIDKYDKIILPGVGSFRDGMKGLQENNFINRICDYVENEGHFMGICLGMQMMFSESHEFGIHKGLGLIKGKIIKIPEKVANKRHKIPHLGWNKLIINNKLQNKIVNDNTYMYFVHSYMANCDTTSIIAYTNYNGIQIPAITNYKESFGCQFHPEKSGEAGLIMLNKFINL